jgi:large-conductance mechanosensitive channel
MASQIMRLYSSFDAKNLVDIEQMQFPTDVVTYNYNLPQAAAFTEYILPDIEKMLEKKAKNSVSNQNIRNLSMGGSSVQKDVVRVFFGLYRVVYMYDGKEYSVWISGDGKRSFHEGLPIDLGRKNALAKKQQQLASVPPPPPKESYGEFIVGIVVCLFLVWYLISYISGMVLSGMVLSGMIQRTTPWFDLFIAFLSIFTALIVIVLLIVLFIALINKLIKKDKELHAQREELDAQREEILRDIRSFEEQLSTSNLRFTEGRKTLRGIYEKVR